MISTQGHAVMDYIIGIILIFSPFLFGFANGGIEMWTPVIMGIVIICYSLLTAYEYGAVTLFTMKTHFGLDIFGGLFLASSPWIFGFSQFVFFPHLIIGTAVLISAAITEKAPQTSTRTAQSI